MTDIENLREIRNDLANEILKLKSRKTPDENLIRIKRIELDFKDSFLANYESLIEFQTAEKAEKIELAKANLPDLLAKAANFVQMQSIYSSLPKGERKQAIESSYNAIKWLRKRYKAEPQPLTDEFQYQLFTELNHFINNIENMKK